MHLVFVAAAALTMGFAGVYLSWLSDNYIHRSLGVHRLVLVSLTIIAACLISFGVPDQALIVAWGFGIWAVVTWVAGYIYYYARRASAGVAHARTMRTLYFWHGCGLALGCGAAALLHWAVLG